MNNKILVTGATGNLGGKTIDFLIEKTPASNIIALVRDMNDERANLLKEKGITLRQGNYDSYDTLVSAFKEVDKLYFVSASDIMNRQSQHENVVNAAIEAGVKHVVYTSVQNSNNTETSAIAYIMAPHLQTENSIKESSMSYTILKHGVYMEMIPVFLGANLLESKQAVFPAAEGRVSFTSRNDMAEVASYILTTEGHSGKTYFLTNTDNYSFSELVSKIGKIKNSDLLYVSPSIDDFKKRLIGFNVPETVANISASFAEAFSLNEMSDVNSDIEKLLNRKPLELNSYLETVYK